MPDFHLDDAQRRSTSTALAPPLALNPHPVAAPAPSVFIPRLRDRVRIAGSEEIFFVVYVDLHRSLADLACAQRVGFLSQIPFKSLLPASLR